MSKLTQISALGKSAIDAVVGPFLATFVRELNQAHIRYELDTTSSELVIHSLEETAGGESGIYRGTARVPYLKADLTAVCPHPLAIETFYPLTFSQLRGQLYARYGVLLEQGEMATSVNGTPLVDENLIATPLMQEYGQFKLFATAFSGRYRAGSSLTLIFIQPTRKPLSGLLDLEAPLSLKPLMGA